MHASCELGNRSRAHLVRGVGRAPCYVPMRPHGGLLHGCKVGGFGLPSVVTIYASVMLVGGEVGFRAGGSVHDLH